jgi:hypothetical protein
MRKRSGRGVVAAVTAVAVLAVVPVLGVTGSTAHADSGGSVSEAQAAAVKAAATGEQVEVAGARTEYATTYANPDGSTFTLDQSAVPVRVQEADGSWAAPDATLEVRSDGSVGPKAAVADMTFSDGGDGSNLVTIAKDGRSLTLGWPGGLPEPKLDGANAVYSNVLPGVDLQMTATLEGFRELLIVRSPEAAANPELAKVEFSLQADGLTVSSASGGGMSAVDGNGRSVFTAPAAEMWDSQGGTATTSTPTATATTASVRTAAFTQATNASVSTDPSSGAVDDPTAGPGEGDASAVLPVQVSDGSLAVVPDATILGNADSSAFPVYIDPSVGLGMTARTQLRSDGYTDFNWDNGSDGEGKGTGHCSSYAGYYCGPGYTERLYYQFSPDALVGKKVLDVTFRDTETWSFSCDPQWVDLLRTSNISSGTGWSNRPNNLGTMASRDVSAGRGSACSPSQPDAPIEFSSSKLTSTVGDFAAGKFSRLTLLVKARDETNTGEWKRFKNNAELSVTYVGLPAVPKRAGIVEGSGIGCSNDSSDPDVIGDPTPDLTAMAEAAYGGRGGANLRVHFYIDAKQPDGTWKVVTEPVRPTSGYVGSGDQITYPSPITLSDSTQYKLAAFTRSYTDGGGSYLESHSTVTTTDWCYFTVDTTAPNPPLITVGSPYVECPPDPCVAAGGPGQSATFTFAPAAGDSGSVVGYVYKLATASSWSSLIPGETVKPSLTPKWAGTQQLQVRAKDTVGRWSQAAVVKFNVAEGKTAVGRWHFADRAPGSVETGAADAATEGTTRYPATLYTTGAGWSSLARRGDGDRSLWLNDTADTSRQSGYAATAQPVVNTKSSFTVSAWAYLTDESAYRTVMSQTGSDGSGFALYYSQGVNRWVFLWSWYENGVHKIQGVNADASGVPLKAWTHLTGVYDHEGRTISLYVNGRLQGAPVSVPTTSDATVVDGALQFGRASFTPGTFVNYWHGRVDEAAVWDRALTGDEIATEDQLLNSDGTSNVELMGSWNPANASGTTLADSKSGYNRSLTLSGGASLDGTSIVLNGKDGAATTPGPVVDDTASFTVSTEVTMDSDALSNMSNGDSQQVLGQRTSAGSAWGLWCHRGEKTTLDDNGNMVTVPVGYWEFGRLEGGTFTSVTSGPEVEVGTPVRLTGTYDAPSGTIHLYLRSVESDADVPHSFPAVAGSGDFAVGEGYVDGAWGHYLAGAVTDIRIWAGAMSDGNQIAGAVGF